MTKQVQRRRGTASQHTSFTGAEGEISVNTTNKSVHVHDGVTAGGVEAARADLANVSDASLNTALAGNTLSSLTITSADINSGTIDGTVIGGTTPAAVTATSLTATGTTTLAGASTTADITFGDNDKAIFGAGSDLQIYHDGSDSYISDTGTGDLYIKGSTYVAIQDASGNNTFAGQAGGASYLYYAGSGKLTTTSTGVDVTGTVTADGLTTGGNIFFDSTSGALRFRTDAGVEKATARLATNDLKIETSGLARTLFAANGDISFYEDTGTTPKFFWDASAESLGIGTSSPANNLSLSAATANLSIINTTAGTEVSPSYSGLKFHGFQENANGYVAGIEAGNSQGSNFRGRLRFLTRDAGSGGAPEERMLIDYQGNVGIGTSSPAELIHIAGGAAAAYLKATNSAGTQGIEVGVSAAGDGVVNVQDAKALRLFTNDTERMRIDSSGRLLVGQTAVSTGARIEVTYTGSSTEYGIALRASADTTSAIVFKNAAGAEVGSITQTASATAYNTSSDYRLKEDVQPMVGASDRVMSLNPVNFAWKADGTRTDGFLAHETQAVAPYAVTGEKDGEEMQSIDHSKLVPLLTAALQEALTEIAALKDRVAALEA